MAGEIVGTLAKTELFGGLDAAVLDEVAAAGAVRPYRKGQILFATGDPGETLFLVIDGMVKIYLTSEDGGELSLGMFAPGSVFGEVALADGGPRSAFAEVVESGRLFVLGRPEFLALLRDHPKLNEAYLRALASRIRRSTDRSEDLVFLDLQGRVAKLLLELAAGSGGAVVALPGGQQELANMVGGSRPTVNQILKTFESRGYITLQGRNISVIELSSLERLAH